MVNLINVDESIQWFIADGLAPEYVDRERQNLIEANRLILALDTIWDELKTCDIDNASDSVRLLGHTYDYLLDQLARRADFPHWGLARVYECRYDQFNRFLFGNGIYI